MRASHVPGTWWRRGVCAATMLVMLSIGTSAFAQDPPPATPPAPDPFTFDVDSMMLFFPVKEASSADFEAVIQQIKDLLTKSEKPERKTQATSFQLIKIEAAQNGIVTYAMLVDPVSKGVSYDFGKILAESLPPDQVKVIFDKLMGSIGGDISRAPLKVVIRKE